MIEKITASLTDGYNVTVPDYTKFPTFAFASYFLKKNTEFFLVVHDKDIKDQIVEGIVTNDNKFLNSYRVLTVEEFNKRNGKVGGKFFGFFVFDPMFKASILPIPSERIICIR